MSSKQRLSPTKLFNTTNLNSNKKDFSNNILENIVHWSQTCHDTILCCSSSSNSSDDSFSKCLILPLKGGSDNGQFVYFGDAILLNNKSNVKIVEGGKINQDEIIIKIDQHKIAGCTLQDVQTLIQTKSTNGQKIILKTCKTGLTKDLRQFLDARFQKGSIDHDLQQTIRDNLYMRTIPCTTRPPRSGETNGQDYTFLSVKEFKALEKSGNLLENGVYKGHYYGTPRPPRDSGTNLLKRSNSVNEMFSNHHNQQQPHRNTKENGNGAIDHHSYPLNINNDPEFFNGHELETHMYNSGGDSPQASSTSSFSNNAHHSSAVMSNNHNMNQHHHHLSSYMNNENGQSNHHSNHQHSRHNPTVVDLDRSQTPPHLSGELINCTLHKGQGGFGFTIIGGNEKGEHYLQIKQILPDSPAYRDGQLAQGDILVFVNNQNVLGYSHTDVVKIFQSLSIGDAIRLTVCRGYPLAVDFDDPTVDVIPLNGVNGNGNGMITSPLSIPTTSELLNGGYTEYYGQREREHDQQIYQISIRKGEKGFGFTVADSLNGQRIKTIVDKQRCHGLCEGDLLLSINGIDLTGKKHLEIVDILIHCTDENDTIFTVKRGQGDVITTHNESSNPNVNNSSTTSTDNNNNNNNNNHTNSHKNVILEKNNHFNNLNQLQQNENLTIRNIRKHVSFLTIENKENHSTKPTSITRDFNEKPRSKTPTPYSNPPLIDSLPLRSRTPLPNNTNRNIGNSTRTQTLTNPYDNNLNFLKQNGYHEHQNNNDNINIQSSIEDTFPRTETFPPKPSIMPMYYNDEHHPYNIDQNGHTWTRSARDIRLNDNNALNNIPPFSTSKLTSNNGTGLRSKTPGPEINSSTQYRNNMNSNLKQRSKTPTTADFSSYNNTLPIQREQQQYDQKIHNSRSLQSVNSHQYYELIVNLTLLRPEDGFGFRIIGGEEDNSQVAVGLIVPNSPAHIDGRLKPGDEIVKIDGHSVIRSSHEKVVELMQQAKQNQRVSLLVRRYQEQQQSQQQKLLQQQIVNGNGTNFMTTRPSENDHHPSYPSNTLKRNGLKSPSTVNNDNNNNNGGVRYITLYKTNDAQSFGFVIISSQNKAGATVGKIIPNSPADYSQQLHVNDRILAVNDVDITHMLHTDVVNLIKESGRSITLKIGPPHDDRLYDVDGLRSNLPTENRTQKSYISQSNSSNGVSNNHHHHRLQSSMRPSSSSPMVIAQTDGINQPQYQIQQEYQTSTNNNNQNATIRNAFSHNPLNILERNPNRPVSRANGVLKSTLSDDYFTIDLQRPHLSSSFGFSIRGGREFSIPLFILKLADNGLAARDGRMRPGDQIIEINNRSTYGMTHQDAISLIKDGGLYVRLLIRKTNAPPPSLDEVKTAMTSPILNTNEFISVPPSQLNGYNHQYHSHVPTGWHNSYDHHS